MVKVQLPRVEKENRIGLNVLKAQRDDDNLDTTIEYLLKLPRISESTITRLEKHRHWVGTEDRTETDDELINRILDEWGSMPVDFIGRTIRNAMDSTEEEIDSWTELHPEFRKWLKKFIKDE